MIRPILNKKISIIDFDDFYWLKKELIDFCKKSNIPVGGSKIEVSNRIRYYLQTGEILKLNKQTSKSKFDWSNEKLTLNTIITDNYKNGVNSRNFFIENIGTHFSFNVIFIKWMKENTGKTLLDAINEWKKINDIKANSNYISEIGEQFEYNRYIRSFLNNNPDLGIKEAIKYWKIKRSIRGNNKYSKTDLYLK